MESPREIKNENGDVIARVWEENPGTMLQCLKCQLTDGERELLEYPATWRKLTDRKLFALCQSGEKR
jgi:hypothetical protein